MSGIDITILVVLAGFLIKGLLRGLLREICSLLGVAVGILLALRYHRGLAETMAATLHLPKSFCLVVTFVLLLVAAVLVFWGIGYFLSRFVQLLFLGGLNRVLGGFFGLAQGVVLLALILFAIAGDSTPNLAQPAIQRSQLAPPFVRFGSATFRGGQQALARWW